MKPINSPSLIIGTTQRSDAAEFDGSDSHGNALQIGLIATVVGNVEDASCLDETADGIVRPGALNLAFQDSTNSWGKPSAATIRRVLFSTWNKPPKVAPQIRVAFSTIALKTGQRSPGELEIT